MHKLFPSQLETEQIYLIVREHWFRLFFKLLVWSFLALILGAFEIFGRQNLPGLFEDQIGEVTGLFVRVFLLILVLGYFSIFVLYYLNIHIITNIRIVDIDQIGLFNHTISELHIDKIEDATSQTTGIFGTIFNYGDVYIQTAGTTERFDFEDVPNPAAIEKLILDLYEKNSNFALDAKKNNP